MTGTPRSEELDARTAIAIVGIGAKMPQALSAGSFWQNILDGVDALGEVPRDRWNPDLYWDENPDAPDKTYSKIGGWITDFEFGRKKYRLPPLVVENMDPTQTLCLDAVHEALEDSGYLDKDFDRENCAVILGNAMGGDLRDRTNLRAFYWEVEEAVRMTLLETARGELSDSKIDQIVDTLEGRFKAELPKITEDAMPGELANVVAGRVAAQFNLRGPNYITDAACASSLAAIEASVRGLQTGQFDMAVSGGFDRCMGAPTFVKFSKIGALSPDGSRPFDAGANGFVMGEGGAAVILKRLEDAERDGDKIYGVIRGVGSSSDGKGKGITAPNPVGQKLAVRRAYQEAGYGPRSVSLFEAHGTSTPVGDPVEVNSLLSVIGEDDGPLGADKIGIGSVKSMIGHLKAGAGAASLVKMAFALKNRTLPPTLNVETPNPRIEMQGTPLHIQTEAEPWETREGVLRRAGVSAFGFGGTNFHVTVEEYDPERGSGGTFATSSAESRSGGVSPSRATPRQALDTDTLSDQERGELNSISAKQDPRGEDDVHSDGILMFAGDTNAEVKAKFAAFAEDFGARGLVATSKWRLCLEAADRQAADRSAGVELPEGAARLALSYDSEEALAQKVERTQRALERGRGWKILANQGIFTSNQTAGGRVAMLFPGQGTQYLGMLGELRERFAIIQATFDEADRIMAPILGRPLTSIIFPETSDLSEDEAREMLRQTEVTQPAVLTVNIALLRFFEQLGIEPDMVAGHSLGEYGACMAAGVMSFEDALRTVAARGTQMAKASPMNGDKGLMASISAPVDEVEEVLNAIDGYVVCANKNCPQQTIIAGLTEPVKEAVAIFEERGHTVHMLNVSHAFHTKVVASASEPLREHLDTVGIHTPKVPILTNVTGGFYPTAPDDIRDLLADQLAAPVEFIKLIETMYASGARVFVEVGPKRAQTTFVKATLGKREHLAAYTNHPKEGGVASLNNALALLWTYGIWRRSERVVGEFNTESTGGTEVSEKPKAPATPVGSGSYSRDEIASTMLQVLCDKTGYDPDEIEYDFELEADLGIDTVKQAEIMADVREEFGLPKDESFRLADYPTLARMGDYVEEKVASSVREHLALDDSSEAPHRDQDGRAPKDSAPKTSHSRGEILSTMLEVLCDKTGYDPDEIEYDFELEADLGIDTVKQAEIMADVREGFSLPKDETFRLADYPTLAKMADYVEEMLAHGPAVEQVTEEAYVEAPNAAAAREAHASKPAEPAESATPASSPTQKYQPVEHDIAARVSVTGTALGLPGLEDIFDEDAVDKLLAGDNFIGDIPMDVRQEMVDKHITRLQKHKDGGGELVEVEDVAEVIKLAGRSLKDVDLEKWGISKRMIEQLDKTSQLAIAAGINALRDAGLPLVPRYRETRSGKKLTIGWQLPEKVGAETGVIFASAFAGEDALIEEVTKRYTQDDYQFDHRFLVKILGMANARFAEMIGARGPNTKINNACASTTTAMAIAEDWIRAGRCKRVVVISADDASGDTLMDWIGSGFLATGAATTEGDVEDAALPFDKRRHGMIIGMGAVGLVIEEEGLAESRGVEPLADIMATHFVNSAFHPTRLDVDHIAGEVGHLLERAEGDFEFERADIADKTVFVSHETYTPARGGSADAEISALRNNFGDKANKIVVANTKGFTGHAMGAGIEDVLAIKSLQKQRVPHIANFKEPDPNLGDLRLSQGGEYPVDYALRLAAGFGSQLALSLLRFRARTEDRIFDEARYNSWLAEVSGFSNPQLSVEERTLRLIEGQPSDNPNGPDGGGEPSEAVHPVLQREKQEREQDALAPSKARAEAPVFDVDPATFEPRPIVVEAHTAAAYDLLELKQNLSGKNIVVLGGPMLVTNTMVRAAERCGATVHVIEDSSNRSPLDTNEDRVCNLLDEAAIEREFAAIGKVDGIINLIGYGPSQTSRASDEADAVYRAARQTYHVARAWQQHLGDESGPVQPSKGQLFISITGMGGRLGFDRSTKPLPVCGSVCGLTKALGREWRDAAVRVVDVAREGFYPELGLQILSEAYADAPSLELGLIGGVRYVPVIVDAEALAGHGSTNTYAPTKDSVVVVVGGAKGITAEVAFDLAERFGCKLALVGRSELSHPDPLGIDIEAEKEKAKGRIAARGERVTPVRINQELRSFHSQMTIAQNLERMRQAGAQAEYFSCDVADIASVEVLFERVTSRFGTIDGVIHAAGVEESKLLADKDLESFDRVFKGKAIGGLNLWAAVSKREPNFFITFSSVAGRFGNEGQVDYSAANEVLNKLVAQIGATTKTNALSIDWTAWGDVGMATHGSMATILEARGVEFLPAHIGAPIVGNAMERGLTGEYLVAGELGEMAGEAVLERSALTGEQVMETNQLVFVDRITEQDTDHVVVERVFDPERDYFLNDHVYQGVPVLPGVMGYEFMVEAARQLATDHLASGDVLEVRDVKFDRAVKFHNAEPLRIIASAEVAERAANHVTIDVKLETERESKTGRTLRKEHFEARVTIGSAAAARPQPLVLDPTDAFDAGPSKLEIYKRYFHTGSFKVLEEVPHIGQEVVIGYGRNPTGRLTASQNGHVFATDPMVREMALQTAGLWGMKNNARSYLPLSIGRSMQFGVAQPGEGICVRCRHRSDASEHAIAFDVEILTEQGRLLQVMEKVELIGHRALDDDEQFEAFSPRRITEHRLTFPEAELILNDLGLEVDEILASSERGAYDRLRSETRRAEWLAARVAAKDLMSCHLRDFFGIRPTLADIVIAKDDNGAPFVELRGDAKSQLGEVALPNITITHSNGVAIAAFAGPGKSARVGIDLELIERRDDSFADNYFSKAERALVVPLGAADNADDTSVLLTTLWSVKEAVSKALGLGLHLSTGEVSVDSLDADGGEVRASIVLNGRAKEAFEAFSGRNLEVRAQLDGTFAFASAWFETGDEVRVSAKAPRPSIANTPEAWVDLAAVAALLKHKGLLERAELGKAKVEGEKLSPWKQ